jgi:hypothetical protein
LCGKVRSDGIRRNGEKEEKAENSFMSFPLIFSLPPFPLGLFVKIRGKK